MNVESLPRSRPIPTLATAAFVVALAATITYFAGLVPVVPETLPLFVDLVTVTGALLVIAVVTWAMSLIGQ